MPQPRLGNSYSVRMSKFALLRPGTSGPTTAESSKTFGENVDRVKKSKKPMGGGWGGWGGGGGGWGGGGWGGVCLGGLKSQ